MRPRAEDSGAQQLGWVMLLIMQDPFDAALDFLPVSSTLPKREFPVDEQGTSPDNRIGFSGESPTGGCAAEEDGNSTMTPADP